MKKLTVKEMWEILENAGYARREHGLEGLLNTICCSLIEQSELCIKKGDTFDMARIYRQEFNDIHDGLKARGYYDK